MCDLTRTTCDVGFANSLERVDALCIFLADLHDLSEGSLPNNFKQIERIYRQGLMPSRLVCNGEVEGSGARCRGVPLIGDVLEARRQERKCSCEYYERATYMGIQYGSQVQTAYEKVVTHVVLSRQALGCAKVGRKRKVRRPRDVAAGGGMGQVSQTLP